MTMTERNPTLYAAGRIGLIFIATLFLRPIGSIGGIVLVLIGWEAGSDNGGYG